MLKIIRFALCSSLVLVLCSCVTVNTDMSSDMDIKGYKRAYIERHPVDEFQMYQALFWEMNDMGKMVVNSPFDDPTEHDLLVRFSYDDGWDMTKYLRSFQFQLIAAKSGRVLTSTYYRSSGVWRGVRDGRLEDAFNDLRSKLGYEPTKQFQ